jgi:S1-C subfamily serine protease
MRPAARRSAAPKRSRTRLVVKRLPAIVILLWFAAPELGWASPAPVDPYTPPGGAVGPALRTEGAHPSVARIIVPEAHSLSLGSGILVGNTERLGLVVTNWHVVAEAVGTIMVVFPDGFRSAGRLMKTDRDWDLAALAIWRPKAPAVPLAAYLPRPG